MTAEEIVALYRRLDSIKAVSKQTRISAQAVRKILVSSGEYSSERVYDVRRNADLITDLSCQNTA